MKFFCRYCGQKLEVDDGCAGLSAPCPACGGTVTFPQPAAADGTVAEIRRLRGDLLVIGGVVLLLLALFFMLTRPPGAHSPPGQAARLLRRAVFGDRVLSAAQRLGMGGQSDEQGQGRDGRGGQSRGSARGQSGQTGEGSQEVADGDQEGAERSGGTNAVGRGNRSSRGGNQGRQPGGQGDSEGAQEGDSQGEVSQAVRQGGRRRSGERVGGPAHEAHPESQPADAASEDADEPEVSIGRLPDQLGSRRGDDRIRAGAGGTDEPSGSIGNTNAPGPANEDAPLTSNPNAPRATRPPSPTPPPENSTYTNRPASAPRRPERNVALLSDTIAERVQRAGGRSGDVQVSLAWNNVNDLDLHVVDPRGEEIYYQHRNSRSGGRLDVDMNVTPQTAQPVENVYWPLRGAPRGQYRVMVNHFRNHGGRDPTAFTIRVLVKGQVRSYASTITFGQPKRLICQFDVP